jgi:hypothetical protein
MAVGRRRIGLTIAIAVGVLAGCGGGGAKSDGAAGSGAGAGGGGGGSVGGSAGGVAGGGTSGGLPACAIATRPNDPVGTSPTCNTVAFGRDWVPAEAFVPTDAGVALDGGAVEEPSGGTILDGDYDLVRYRSPAGSSIRRSIRLFDGGTFFEWLNATVSGDVDGGVVNQARFNTSQQPSHPEQFMLTIACADSGITTPSRYAYTATGDELVLFVHLETGVLNVNTYRRTCRR